jgi:AcrR family transcriptional regulator
MSSATEDTRRGGIPSQLEGLSQEERILWSMVRAIAEKGYEAVTIADVVERASVSRSKFYELFDNKEECLFAAYERINEILVALVSKAFEGEAPWPTKVRRSLEAVLQAYAIEPEIARMATVEVPAAGPEAQRRYREAAMRFLPFFAEGRKYAKGGADLPADLELMSLGGAEAIVFDEVVAGRGATLPSMLPEILFAILVPYVGPEAAAAEMRRAGGADAA